MMNKDIEISVNSILKIPITLVKCLGIAIITMFFMLSATILTLVVHHGIITTTSAQFCSTMWYLCKCGIVIAFVVGIVALIDNLWQKDYKIKIPLNKKPKLPKAIINK